MPDSALIGEALLAIQLRKGALTRAFDEELTAASGLASHHGGVIGKALSTGFTVAKVGAEAVGGGMVAIGLASAKLAVDFQRSMTMIHTQAGAVNEDLGKLGQALLQLAPEVGFSPDELAQSLYHVESAGFRSASAVNAVAAASKLAQIGGANLEDTTQAVIAAMAAWPKYAGDATSAAAILNAVVGTGDMRMEQLAKAMATGIGPAAANFGLSLTDVGAGLATLTDNATPADEAATRLRMSFALLGAPSNKAADSLKALGLSAEDVKGALSNRDFLKTYGISVTSLADDLHKPNGLLVAITDLKTHLDNAGLSAEQQSAVISKAFGGGRTSAAIETLLTEFDRFKGKYTAITDGANNFGNAWEETKNTVAQQWKDLQASAEVIGVQIGSYLLGPLSGGMRLASDGLTRLSGTVQTDVMPKLQQFGDYFRDTIIPDSERVGRYLADTFGPSASTIAHTLLDIGRTAKDDFLPPLISFARDVGPPIIDVITFITNHESLLIALLTAMVARFVVIKGLGMVEWGLGMANSFRLMLANQGALNALLATLGLGGTQGISGAMRGVAGEASGLRIPLELLAEQEKAVTASTTEATAALDAQAASLGRGRDPATGRFIRVVKQDAEEAVPALEGAATKIGAVEGAAAGAEEGVAGLGTAFAGLGGPIGLGVAAVGAAALAIGTDAGGIRTDLKNAFFGEDYAAEFANLNDQFKQQGQNLAQAALQGYETGNTSGDFHDAIESFLRPLNDQIKQQAQQMAQSDTVSGATDWMQEPGIKPGTSYDDKYQAALKSIPNSHLLDDYNKGLLTTAQVIDAIRKQAPALASAYDAAMAQMASQAAQRSADIKASMTQAWAQTASSVDQDNANIQKALGLTHDQAEKWLQDHNAGVRDLDTRYQGLSSQFGLSRADFLSMSTTMITETDAMGHTFQVSLLDIWEQQHIAQDIADITGQIANLKGELDRGKISADSFASSLQNLHAAATSAAGGGGGGAGLVDTLIPHAAGGKFYTPHMAMVGDAPGGPEWVINTQQAGPFAGLLDYLVGVGGAPGSPSAGGGGGSDPVVAAIGRLEAQMGQLGRTMLAAQGGTTQTLNLTAPSAQSDYAARLAWNLRRA